MKITLGADGSIELEVADGDGQAALDMIRSLTANGQGTLPPAKHSPTVPKAQASLTALQRQTYEVLAAFPEGAHYTVVAEFLNAKPSAANSRLQNLRVLGLATWVRAGVYAPVIQPEGVA